MPASVFRIPQLPQHQRALHRAGIHSGVLDVEYHPKPPFFRDNPNRYAFAQLTLYAYEGPDKQRTETVSLRFQRHVLGPHDPPTEASISDSRFDYGPLPWSAFYAPALVTPPLPLPASPKLDRLVQSVRAIDALMHSTEVADALRGVTAVHCFLTLYLQVLESQRVAVEVFHHLQNRSWPEHELLARASCFSPGTAAALLDARASDLTT